MKTAFQFLVISIVGAWLVSATFAGAMHDAAARGDTAAMEKLLAGNKKLLEEKAEWLNQKEGWRLMGTPLHIAAIHGQTDTIKFLIAKGADVNATDSEEFTPLALAAYLGKKEAVELLLKTKGVNIHAVTHENKTALLLALEGFPLGEPVPHETRAAICDILLASGVNPNVKDAYKVTPLHIAVSLEITPAVKSLIAKGADVNAEDEDARTPLSIAEIDGLKEIIKMLKEAGAK